MATGNDFEALLQVVGSEGRWQWGVFFAATLSGFFCAMHNLGSAFLASTPDHWCSVDGLPKGWGVDRPALKQLVLPREQRHGHTVYSQCTYYVRDYEGWLLSNTSSSGVESWLQHRNITNATEEAEIRSCSGWEFDTNDYRITVVTEWQLVCGAKGLAATIQATYMVGALIGSMTISPLADRYGRRLAFLLSLGLFLVSATGTAFAPNYLTFVALRLITAIGLCGTYICPYIVVAEVTGSPQLRSFFGIIFNIPFAIGYMVLPGAAYLLRDWSSLQLALSLPGLSLFLVYCFVPESPRWLIGKGRFLEALRILRHGAKINRKQLPADDEILITMKTLKKKEETLQEENQRRNHRCAILELCRYPVLRKLTAIVYFTWFAVAMAYYGLALNSPQMSSDPYLVFFAAGAVEVPAYALTFGAVQWAGRRRSYAWTFLLGGIACLCIIPIPRDHSSVRATLAVLGKFSVTATFSLSYLYTAELFPTEVRTMAVGYGSVFARFGSITAPYINDLLGAYHDVIPMIVFGSLSVVSGLLSFLLPETESAALPESIAAVAKMKERPFYQPSILKFNILTQNEKLNEELKEETEDDDNESPVRSADIR